MLNTLLLVAALICFCVAVFQQAEPYRGRVIAAGLAFWVLALLIPGLR